MKTFHVKVAVRILDIYKIEPDGVDAARDGWSDGDLIHTVDEAFETEVLSVEEV